MAIRQHPRLAGLMKHRDREQGDSVIDVTDYPDIQELLAVADVVITDYSSAIFDFMLTEKPGFLLAEDYENYKDMRGLYYPLEETPFPLARSEEELLENIAGFDEDAYKEKVRQFLHRKGTREDGNAAKRVVGLIKEIISKDEKND